MKDYLQIKFLLFQDFINFVFIIIVVMQSKQNIGRRKKIKEGPTIATLTTQVSHILRAINTNGLWKNNSAKLNKTVNTKQQTTGKTNKKNLMTQQDIDRLFNRQKSKTKVDQTIKTQQNILQEWHPKLFKDFANSVKFLKVDDSTDKLLNGLPNLNQLDQDKIDALFDQETQDLTAEFKKDYTVGRVVGEGAYASVRVATYKPLGKKVAIKVYQKAKLRQPQRKKSVRREIRILQMLNHPNIVKILDVVQTNNHLNIIMQYLEGISLNNYLKNQPNHRASENNCKGFIRSLAQALEYLHLRQISHRDIKLQNIILKEDLSPKLIDFGFSTCIQKNKKVKIFCGTPSYMAPQIVQKKEYRGQPADVWALGVLTFVTLTGIFPFKGSTDQELYKKINSADYPRHELYFSKEVSDLVSRMLRINPDQRITAAQILLHPWLRVESQFFKRQKKTTEASQGCRKRTTTSSHKSREKQQNPMNITGNMRKLTQTCNDNNLKLQLRMLRQSPLKLNSTNTHRKTIKQVNTKPVKDKMFKKQATKCNVKVLQLLKVGLRRVQDKSKSKSRRF